MILLYPADFQGKEISIQQQIYAANPGDLIEISEGIYNESIIITKPIRLIGNDKVTFTSNHKEPIISIQASDVTIENLRLDYDSETEGSTAVLINGNNNTLKNMIIDTNEFGIKLDHANNNQLSEIELTGKESSSFSERQHGIDLWKSDNNEIHNTTIKHVMDGIYIESSNKTNIHHNDISKSRYGTHLMFTKESIVEENKSSENVSGLMMMDTKGMKVNHNTLEYNQENVQSLGLLLFNVEDATVTNNVILNNRIGIFVERSSNNDISHNQVQNNYIGLEFKGAKDNTINQNTFIANVAQGQAEESSNNYIEVNYWEDHIGLDVTGNNRSDLPYEIDPFYLNLTNEYPPFQLLFQSPGIIFLEQLFITPDEEKMVDSSPLIESNLAGVATEENDYLLILLSSLGLLLISTTIIMMGVKKI